MKTARSRKPVRPDRPSSRFGYDRRWWGKAAQEGLSNGSYWSLIRRPLPCLVFVLPLLLVYELGVVWLGGESADLVRTGADAWMRMGRRLAVGLTDRFLAAAGLDPGPARLAGGLHAKDWRFPPGYPLSGWRLREFVLAVAFDRAEPPRPRPSRVQPSRKPTGACRRIRPPGAAGHQLPRGRRV